MPSAANVKIEKPIGPEGGLTDAGNSTPLRQAITVIEHKIRNLEKRKSKLESYRDLQRSGKDLNQDQKTAVAKYDEVVQTLEFARDLCKQFLGIAVVSEKDEKKKARKDAIAKSQSELTKVREVLLVQDALSNMGQEVIREDFLNGRNGAAQLTQGDLKLLDDLYLVVSPKHEAGDPTAFIPQVQAAAEHLLAVADGKTKEAFGATYSQIKEVIGKIHESGYLDQAVEPYVEECPVAVEEPVAAPMVNPAEPIPVQGMDNMQLEQQMKPPPHQIQPDLMPPQPQQMQQQQQPLPQQMQQQQQPPPQPMEQQMPMQSVPEQMYYQQPPPQARPITEVLGTGSFFFLQESELDTPPEQIPSQTFTNQTYGGALPPPIPMPPHFQQFPNAPQQMPQQQPPVMQAPPQQQLQSQTNNGIGDHLPDVQEDVNRQRGGRHAPPQQRSANTAHHHQQPPQQQQQQQQQQPFFANNNGYNNRPNNNRTRNNNGPRPNNRHNQ